jgi:hypothetical protein
MVVGRREYGDFACENLNFPAIDSIVRRSFQRILGNASLASLRDSLCLREILV